MPARPIPARWIEKRKPHWARLEALVAACGRRSVASLSHPEVRELALLYRQTAADLGYGSYFIDQVGQSITDDHMPFLRKGMHVIDVLDIQYGPLPPAHDAFTPPNPNYHHTMQDTFDKVSAKSLQVVGDVAVTLVK